MGRRTPLSREQVITAAVALADEKGVAGVTMRAVAGVVGVEAMSLYNHVAGREGILDGMVDVVFSEISLPEKGVHWREAMRARASSARATLGRHPWAVALMDSRRSPGEATLRHHNAVLGALRGGGFSIVMAGHAVSLIDSYVYGFVLQEVGLPFSTRDELEEVAGEIMGDLPADAYPYLTEIMGSYASRPDYAYADEFGFGLELILGALGPDEIPAPPG